MSQIVQVKDATDLVEIIGERVDLKKSGRNYRGLCPFHSEKTPSFFVSPEIGRYKCFGCGETGDVFNFLEKYEGMTFAEALRYLADRAGIELVKYQPSAADKTRDELLEILSLAGEYYHFLLTKHQAGQPARDYLKKRGTTQASVNTFNLGYSPDSWDGLVKYLHHKKKYPLDQLVKTGLVIKGRGRHYDRFRGRIMFPLKNHRGQVVGFSGRTLKTDVKEAKYINTPETLLYHKAQLLFGYHELLQHIRQKEAVIVTEGEFDVISSTQAHVNHIVAIKGSAFTLDHAKYIKRVASKVLFALDLDSAGVEATKRAIPIATEQDLELRIIMLGQLSDEDKKDPDDVARADPQVWRQLVKESISAYEFLIKAALHDHDPKTPEGKREIINQLAIVIDEIEHEVEKDFYLKELATHLNVKPEVVKRDLSYQAAKQRSGKKDKKPAKDIETKISRRQKLEQYAWFLLLRSQDDQVKELAQNLADNYQFKESTHQLLLDQLLEFKPAYSLESFSNFLADDLQQLVLELYLLPEHTAHFEEIKIEKEWQQVLVELEKISARAKLDKITQELDQLDQKNKKTAVEEARQQELLEQIVQLRSKVK